MIVFLTRKQSVACYREAQHRHTTMKGNGRYRELDDKTKQDIDAEFVGTRAEMAVSVYTECPLGNTWNRESGGGCADLNWHGCKIQVKGTDNDFARIYTDKKEVREADATVVCIVGRTKRRGGHVTICGWATRAEVLACKTPAKRNEPHGAKAIRPECFHPIDELENYALAFHKQD